MYTMKNTSLCVNDVRGHRKYSVSGIWMLGKISGHRQRSVQVIRG